MEGVEQGEVGAVKEIEKCLESVCGWTEIGSVDLKKRFPFYL